MNDNVVRRIDPRLCRLFASSETSYHATSRQRAEGGGSKQDSSYSNFGDSPAAAVAAAAGVAAATAEAAKAIYYPAAG